MNQVQQILNQYGLKLVNYTPNPDMAALMPTPIRTHITLANVVINNHDFVLIDIDDDLNDDRFIQLIKLLKNIPFPVIFITDNLTSETQLNIMQNNFGFISHNGFFLPAIKPVTLNKPTMQLISLSKNQQIIILALIYWKLLQDDNSNIFHIKVRQLAKFLDITPMTISRALRTFVDAGWLATSGYTRNHSFAIPAGFDLNSWIQEILHFLPSPVQKTVYIPLNDATKITNKRLTNLTALSKFTLVAPSAMLNWAIPAKDLTANLRTVCIPEFNASLAPKKHLAVELWKYDAAIFSQFLPANYQIAVDPISLYLSLRNFHDKQVHEQLNVLLQNLVKQRKK